MPGRTDMLVLGGRHEEKSKPQRFVWNAEGSGYHGGISCASLCWR